MGLLICTCAYIISAQNLLKLRWPCNSSALDFLLDFPFRFSLSFSKYNLGSLYVLWLPKSHDNLGFYYPKSHEILGFMLEIMEHMGERVAGQGKGRGRATTTLHFYTKILYPLIRENMRLSLTNKRKSHVFFEKLKCSSTFKHEPPLKPPFDPKPSS